MFKIYNPDDKPFISSIEGQFLRIAPHGFAISELGEEINRAFPQLEVAIATEEEAAAIAGQADKYFANLEKQDKIRAKYDATMAKADARKAVVVRQRILAEAKVAEKEAAKRFSELVKAEKPKASEKLGKIKSKKGNRK